MKRKNTTRNALLTSIISMLLCVSMLVGATFAWFTDEVKSGTNVITAGNLDVEVYTADGNSIQDVETLFNDVTLWEPGAVAWENLTVVNEGNLALKYDLSINFTNENHLKGNGLSTALKIGVVEDGVTEGTREAVVNEVSEWTSLVDFVEHGYLLNQNDSKTYGLVIWWEPSADDNKWNVQNNKETSDGKALHIDLGVKLFATQMPKEDDSFDKNYDENAAWASHADASWYNDTDTTFTLNSAEQLAGLAQLVNAGNTFEGKTILLGKDIDLNDRLWTPIGQGTKPFAGKFDGQGHTISNLYVNGNADLGLFGRVFKSGNHAVITNVKIEKATIIGNHWLGGIVGRAYGDITNCTVNNATITCSAEWTGTEWDNGDKVGGIVGLCNDGTYQITGNTVTNATITGYRDVGGIVGLTSSNTNVSGNTVENVTLICDASHNYKTAYSKPADYDLGAIAGEGEIDDNNVVTNVDIFTPTFVGSSEDIENALDQNDAHIIINLTEDVTVNVTSWNTLAFGGADTKDITINGNGNALTFSLNDSDWSHVSTVNDAELILNNVTVESTKYNTGHWKRVCVHFDCPVEMNDVVANTGLGFKDDAKLNNVEINQIGDNYSMWIWANGQTVTVDGLDIDCSGRGIKIADEDSAKTAGTTLDIKNADFVTAKKAAILVSSVNGAIVNVGENVNLSGVKADSTNAVWVDEDWEDSYDSVTVTGGTKIYEGNVVSNAAELAKAVQDGKTDLWLLDGEYDVYGCGGKTLTISGTKNAVITVVGGEQGEAGGQLDYGFDGSTVTFNGVTIKTNNATYAGYARLTGTYNNCVFENCYCLNGNSVFTNCTFNVSGDQYNVWTWGAPTAAFNGCTFNSDGKALLLYGTENTKLTIDGCTFNDNGGLTDLKAAIEIGNDYNKSYELIVNSTVVNGYEINDKGISTGTTLWANKNSMGTDKLNVVIDGVDVY